MANEKVVIPQEVAEAIEKLRKNDISNEHIIQKRIQDGRWFADLYQTIMVTVDFDTLVKALYNGYTIEKKITLELTPEEVVFIAASIGHSCIRDRRGYCERYGVSTDHSFTFESEMGRQFKALALEEDRS